MWHGILSSLNLISCQKAQLEQNNAIIKLHPLVQKHNWCELDNFVNPIWTEVGGKTQLELWQWKYNNLPT